MRDPLVVLLVAGLVIAGWQLWTQGRHIRDLSESIRRRQAFLQDGTPGLPGGKRWRRFRAELNDLIDEHKRLRSDRASQVGQLQATLENIREAVLIVDPANRIVLANDSFCMRFATRPEVMGQSIETVCSSSGLLAYIGEVRDGSGGIRREVGFEVGGETVWAEATGSAIPAFGEDPSELTLFVLHDITRLKQLEQMRKEFVANVSHELRTPLSMIRGYAETLADGGDKVSREDRRRFLGTIRKHADRLNGLLEDLLTLSRLEGGRQELFPETVELSALIREIVAGFREAGLASAARFEWQLDPRKVRVSVDVPRITQVLENLIDNAVKYSPGEPVIEIGTLASGGRVRVWVRDRGVGIAARDLPHIFERFYRADKGRSREKGGTGLGLSIVKHIVQLHGGTTGAESSPGRGTIVYFFLPLHEEERRCAVVSSGQSAGTSSMS